MNGLREMCHCGHTLSSHFLEHFADLSTARLACLCMGCGCKRYVNEHEPKPAPELGERPMHADHCRCSRCKAFL